MIHGLCRQIDWQLYTLELAGTADSSEKALALLRQKSIDILFTDICMPRTDGLKLISVAKQENPNLRIVIISAYREFDYIKKALLIGVENYLLKPIDQIELNRTLEKLMDNLNRERNYEAHSASSAFRHNILDRWVNAAIQDYEFYERAEALEIDLSAKQYQLCVLEVLAVHTDSRKLMKIEQVLKKCQSVFGFLFAGECFRDRLDRVVSILCGTDLQGKQEKLSALLDALHLDADKQGVKLFTSISPISDGIENVARDYSCAVDYLNYRFIEPQANRIFSAESLTAFRHYGCEPAQVQLGYALTLETIDKADAAIEKLFELCGSENIKTVKACAIPLLMLLLKQIDEAGHLSQLLPYMETTSFASFGTIASIGELRLWFHGLVSETFALMGIRGQLLSPLVQQTLDKIKKDYHSELSLKSIALFLKVSPAYLGQLFNNEIGKYFNDYLMEVRLQASRVLLLETDLRIREILCRIGMESQSYYNRAFKKAYGISPGEFRRQVSFQRDNAQ